MGVGAPASDVPAAYERACVSPEAWEAAQREAAGLPPITPHKPVAKVPKPRGGGAKASATGEPKPKAASKSSKLATATAGAGASKFASTALVSQHLVSQPVTTALLSSTSAAASSAPLSLAPIERPGSERHSASGSEQGDLPRPGQYALATLDSLDADMDDDDGVPLDDAAAEDKRLKRMRRNRESAAMSRNRKKQYVEELETQVASLHEHVRSLQSENFELRRACARARGSSLEEPPALPLLTDAHELGSPSGLPALPFVDALAEDDARPSPGHKRSGSPLLGGMNKKGASAASLALMSAVTFVTLSVAGHAGADGTSGSGLVPAGSHHGQRALMSLNDYAAHALPSSITDLLGRAPVHDPATVDAAVDEAVGRLWPSLNLHDAPYDRVGAPAYPNAFEALHTALPPPNAAPKSTAAHHGAPAGVGGAIGSAATARGYGERVIRAPQNSSWADVLRIEAAEKQLAEAQLTLRSLGRYPPSHPPSVKAHAEAQAAAAVETVASAADAEQVSPHVGETTTTALAAPRAAAPRYARPNQFDRYEHLPRFEPSLDAEGDEYDAQRYIFCSRAYMFDAAVRRSPKAAAFGASDAVGSELDLPAKMPARFRHGADFYQQELPQVTDGNTSAGAAASKLPVVNLLLPSAALQGVQGVQEEEDKAELMQVQCQVLNASRVASPVGN